MASKSVRILFFAFLTFIVMTMQSNGIRAEELAPHLYKTIFENGQTVVVKEVPGSNVVTVQIWVKAGSVYEDPAEAGITHFIEHMIFKGTPTRGPGALAEAIEGGGGRINAYTSYENTVYHATLSARHWALAMEVLIDAVLHSIFDPEELEREKKVVLEEVGMRNDRPNIKLFQELLSTAFKVHPYRLPVIGNIDTIKSFNREAILSYMEKHYQPKNMAVVVVGDVNNDEVLDLVRKQMGSLNNGGFKQPSLPEEDMPASPRLFSIEADINQPQLAMAFPITRFADPDTPVLDVISNIVGHGETSRLYRSLRDEKRLVYSIDGSAFTPHDPGLFEIFAVLDEKNMDAALEAALVELFRLKYFQVSNEELTRAKRNLESDFIFNLERVEGQARVLGSFEFMAGDPREDEYLEAVRAVTVDDIQQVAAKYFVGERLTVGSLIGPGSAYTLDESGLNRLIENAESAARISDSASLLEDTYLSGVHRFTLDNGLKLLVREDQSVPTVAIRAVFPGGLRAETPADNGAFAFISDLLPKGTESMSAQEIAVKVANMAGGLSGFNGKNTYGIKADFLSRFFEEGLLLVKDVIRTPAFDPAEAEKIRAQLLSQLKQQEDSLTGLAFKEFNKVLFDGHPYSLNTIGSEDAIKSFTVDSLNKKYESHASPDKLVLAVSGAVEARKVHELVEQYFGDWSERGDTLQSDIQEEILPPYRPLAPRKIEISRDKEQVHLVIGFLGTTIDSADRYSLEVLEMVLSGQSGRLFTELRDRQSLAYSLSSFSLLGLDTGAFGIYIGTSPDKKEQAIKGIWEELNRVRESSVSETELTRAKNILIAQYELGLQTHSSQALEMALNETYNLGQDFGNRYIEKIEEVDVNSVLAVARKYILPDNFVMVSVGAQAVTDEENKDLSADQEENSE